MRFIDIKREIFFVRKAFVEYQNGWRYLAQRFRARKILRHSRPLDRKADRSDLSIHMLTGKRDFTMAMWSLWSFYRATPMVGELYLHDDGTLGEKQRRVFARLFPEAKLISTVPIPDPVFRGFRERYPGYFSFKKIIDPYYASNKPWRLILDSDVLWFGMPSELVSAVNDDSQVSYMQYNNAEILGTHANAGIVLYRHDLLDTVRLKEVFESLVLRERGLHFADQVGYASALANLVLLPQRRYTIKGSVHLETVAKHYTSPRRPLYYLEGLSKFSSEMP